jgi:hypothetical protein
MRNVNLRGLCERWSLNLPVTVQFRTLRPPLPPPGLSTLKEFHLKFNVLCLFVLVVTKQTKRPNAKKSCSCLTRWIFFSFLLFVFFIYKSYLCKSQNAFSNTRDADPKHTENFAMKDPRSEQVRTHICQPPMKIPTSPNF